MFPPEGVNLQAFCNRFQNTCVIRELSANTCVSVAVISTESRIFFFVATSPAIVLQGVLQESADIDDLSAEIQLSVNDAIDVEQVVNQPRLDFDVSPDRGQVLLHIFRKTLVLLQHRHDGQDRRQGRAQFVTQNGEEIVFLLIGQAQILLAGGESGVALAQSRQHLVESVGQLPDFVGAYLVPRTE